MHLKHAEKSPVNHRKALEREILFIEGQQDNRGAAPENRFISLGTYPSRDRHFVLHLIFKVIGRTRLQKPLAMRFKYRFSARIDRELSVYFFDVRLYGANR